MTLRYYLSPTLVAALQFFNDNHEKCTSDDEDIDDLLSYHEKYPDIFTLPPKELAEQLSISDQTPDVDCFLDITQSNVVLLSKLLRELHYPNYRVSELLAQTTLCFRTMSKSNYTPEFAAKLRFLSDRNMREEYNRSMAGVRNPLINSTNDPTASKVLDKIGTPLNLIAVSLTLGFVGYFLASRIAPDNIMVQYMVGILGILGGFILETILFVIRDFNQNEKQEKAKNHIGKKERLEIQRIQAQIQRENFDKAFRFASEKKAQVEAEHRAKREEFLAKKRGILAKHGLSDPEQTGQQQEATPEESQPLLTSKPKLD